MLYGNDFFLAQSAGFELNRDGSRKWNSNTSMGLAMPQAYLEVGSDTLFVQVGHFYTVVGYEGVQSANNFFYSHAYSYQFAGPFTQWGGLVTWRPNSNWEVQAGPVNGWNTLDGTPNNVEFLGKLRLQSPIEPATAFCTIERSPTTSNTSSINGSVPSRTEPQTDRPPTGTVSISICFIRSTIAGNSAVASNGSAMKTAPESV